MDDASTRSLAKSADHWELSREVQVDLQKQIASWHERARNNIDRIVCFLNHRLENQSVLIAMLNPFPESSGTLQDMGLVIPLLIKASVQSLQTESGSRRFGLLNVQQVMKQFASDAMDRMAKEWGEGSFSEDVFAAAMQSASIELRSESEKIAECGFEVLASSEDRTALMDAVCADLNESRVRHIRAYKGPREMYRIRKSQPVGQENQEVLLEQRLPDVPAIRADQSQADKLERFESAAGSESAIDDNCLPSQPIAESTNTKSRQTRDRDECLYPKRALWLVDRMNERNWKQRYQLSILGGPDPKSVRRVFNGFRVGEKVLRELAARLSMVPPELGEIPCD